MKYLIAHAYSSTNAGDGLLVEEALALIKEADGECDVTVLALDPDSFDDRAGVRFIHPFTGEPKTPSNIRTLMLSFLSILRGLSLPRRTVHLFDKADLVVGVGGGYMRGAHFIEAVKMVLVHLPQLAAANRSQTKAVYLPQSVGALRWGTKFLVRAHANRVVWHVRDDRSLGVLDDNAIVRRTPDTAVLPLGNSPANSLVGKAPGTPNFGLVARSLSSTRTRLARYHSALRAVAADLLPQPLLQASARGNNDDEFYRELLGVAAQQTLSEATNVKAAARPQVVISVRLHGAIQSIRNGVPAIHLSYERKGWGAYEDLGIGKYVHNAFDFDPDLVVRQARQLADDSSEYWSSIANSSDRIRTARSRLLADLLISEG